MMGLSYTEELVSEFFKHLTEMNKSKYVVLEKVKYRGLKGIGWTDIDVLAIGDKEIYIVETKEYAFRASKMKSIRQISDSLNAAERFVKKQFYGKGRRRIIKVFVATKMPRPFEEGLRKLGIKSYRLDDVVRSLLLMLNERKYPKEESNVTRTLLMLLEADFVKEDVLGGQ